MRQFSNLIDVITHFSDQKTAMDYLIQMRWNGNITCAHCSHDKVYELKGATKRFKCAKCRQQFSATKGSIFENSAIPLQKWFAAIYLITSHKKGISSHQLAKDVSLTQKSAWFVLQRVRYALQSGTFEHKDRDIYQMDETYVGGKEKNKHQEKRSTKTPSKNLITSGRGFKTWMDMKTPVAGILQTNGKVITQKVESTKGKTLIPMLEKYVPKGSTVVTDEHTGYFKLSSVGYDHQSVNHKAGEYVRGDYHTNGIENFWSLFKRGIIGIYHQISVKHLDKYLDEFEFRFNNRKLGDADRFSKMLTLCSRRLTYPQLIANYGTENETTS